MNRSLPDDRGAQIKQMRVESLMTQGELARRAGITRVALCRIELGQVIPRDITIRKVMAILSSSKRDRHECYKVTLLGRRGRDYLALGQQWYSNELQVRIPSELVDKFLKAVGGRQYDERPDEVLCAHKIIPYPKEYRDRDIVCYNILGDDLGLVVECPKCGPMKSTKATWSKDDKKHHCATCGSTCTDYKDGFNSGGYEWCNDHWGTKWGFCQPRLVQRSYQLVGKKNITHISFEFDTAWSPPSPLIAAMAAQWPQARFHLSYKLEGGGGTEEYAAGNRKQRTMHECDEDEGDLVPMGEQVRQANTKSSKKKG